ncbi:MAG: dihydrodipicolinate synthase family protein, partial [Nitrospinota bacterium]
PQLIARINREVTGVHYLKLEDPPVGPKLTRIRELTQDRMKIFGGLGGAYFLEELQRGAVGIMTGLAFPEILVRIFHKFTSGDRLGAAETFDHYMPLIRYEAQPKIGLAFRKYIYQRRGLIATTTVRHPGPTLDTYTARELEEIIQRVGLSLEKVGVQEVI